jgi:hypothetical protein
VGGVSWRAGEAVRSIFLEETGDWELVFLEGG